MAGCCGSDERSRARKLLWPAVWLLIGAFVAGLWVWERQPHHPHAEVGPHGGPLAVRPAVQFSGQKADCVRGAPLLNEHGAAIRAALAGAGHWPAAAVMANGSRTDSST